MGSAGAGAHQHFAGAGADRSVLFCRGDDAGNRVPRGRRLVLLAVQRPFGRMLLQISLVYLPTLLVLLLLSPLM